MTKQKNILGERPRRKNNKRIKTSEAFDMKREFENVIAIDTAHNDMVDSTAYVMLNIGLCEKPEPKEMSFGKAFAIVIGAVLVFGVLFPLLQHAVDTNALNNCEEHGDCAEVIRDINAR